MKTVKEILKEAAPADHLSKMDTRFPAGYPSDKQMPAVIVLKRKAIRTFPDHQKIGLYYSQQLDKYVSIPFDDNSKALGIHINEAKEENKDSLTPEQRYIYNLMNKKNKKVDPEKFMQNLHPRDAARLKGGLKAHMKKALSQNSGSFEDTMHMLGKFAGYGILALNPFKSKIEIPKETSTKTELPKNTPTTSEPKPATTEPPKNTPTTPELKSSTSEPTPTKTDTTKVQKNKKLDVANRPLRYRSPEETAKRMRENPSASYSAGAQRHAAKAKTVKENFQDKLKKRKNEKLEEHIVADIIKNVAVKAGPAIKNIISKSGPAIKDTLSKTYKNVSPTVKNILKKAAEKGKNFINKATTLATGAGLNALTSGGGSDGGFGKTDTSMGFDRFSRMGVSSNEKHPTIGSLKPNVSPGGGISSKQIKDTELMFGNPTTGKRKTILGPSLGQQDESVVKESNLNIIKKIVNENLNKEEIMFNNCSINVTNRIAKKIINIYESLNNQNKKKIEKMLNENVNSFRKIVNFAVRQ